MLALTAGQNPARADSHVTVRGQYYREPSTRVVQPVVEIASDLPAGFDVSAHYLLDAITSASAASGPTGDNIFTEFRNESGVQAGLTLANWRIGVGYKYSAESDYWSHALVASAAVRVWGDTGTLALSGGLGFDQVGRRVQGNAPTPTPAPGAACAPSGAVTCPLDTMFGGVGYSQVLSPTWLVQGGYEFALLDGYLASPYRAVGSLGPEQLPNKRMRNAASARVAKYLPALAGGAQLNYRFYFDLTPGGTSGSGGDPWHLRSHTVELRLFKELGSDWEFRLTTRFYSQRPPNFWCDYSAANNACDLGSRYFTSEPQLTRVRTAFVELKAYWQAAPLLGLPVVGWLSQGTFELSYGQFFQSTSFADAHLLQTGYSLPF